MMFSLLTEAEDYSLPSEHNISNIEHPLSLSHSLFSSLSRGWWVVGGRGGPKNKIKKIQIFIQILFEKKMF